MRYGLKRTTDATTEPVTRAEAKLHLRIVADEDNSLIDNLITAARMYCEERTNRQFISATWDLYLDQFPLGLTPLYLPRAPLISITTLKYYDTAGSQQTWASSNYLVSSGREPGCIRLAYQVVWPSIQFRPDAVNVTYLAGWANAAAVPMPIKQAMLLLIGHFYENRESVVVGAVSNAVQLATEALLAPYTVGDEFTCYAREDQPWYEQAY